MEVFGQEYDVSKMTPAEIKELEDWYAKNKDEVVPTITKDSTQLTGASQHEVINPDGGDNPGYIVEAAMDLLKGNKTFEPDLKGKHESIELYRLVHPLGGNKSVEEAAEELGVNKTTAYRRLARLAKLNPEVYDLHKWPSKAQVDVYRLIHPDLGGLTYQEAAKALKSTYQHVVQMMCRMRSTHPAAFAFERIRYNHKPRIKTYSAPHDDEHIKERF